MLPYPYSLRNVTTGSMRVARRAGRYVATNADSRSDTETSATTVPSIGWGSIEHCADKPWERQGSDQPGAQTGGGDLHALLRDQSDDRGSWRSKRGSRFHAFSVQRAALALGSLVRRRGLQAGLSRCDDRGAREDARHDAGTGDRVQQARSRTSIAGLYPDARKANRHRGSGNARAARSPCAQTRARRCAVLPGSPARCRP